MNRALLESSAAEHAARMTRWTRATRNAKEMVDRLTLYMNKVRQAAITREIIEIVVGRAGDLGAEDSGTRAIQASGRKPADESRSDYSYEH